MLAQTATKTEWRPAWMPILRSLVMMIQDERSAEALLMAVAGHDLAAGVVLHKLLELFPKSIRDDGAIWQADRYWLMQCGITYARICRVRTRLSGLLDIWVANAQRRANSSLSPADGGFFAGGGR